MGFKDQIENAKLIIDTSPRYYLKWDNTKEGRDKTDCYERLNVGTSVIYVNQYNKNVSILKGEPFWDTLESMFNELS